MFNYPDFLKWQIEDASAALFFKKREKGDTTTAAQIRQSSTWCLQWSFTREEDADKDQVLWIKRSEGVQRVKGTSSSQQSAAIGSVDGLQSLLKSQRAQILWDSKLNWHSPMWDPQWVRDKAPVKISWWTKNLEYGEWGPPQRWFIANRRENKCNKKRVGWDTLIRSRVSLVNL